MIETPELMAFLDASVLYPSLLRNLLMYFAVADAYQPRWSAEVHREWMTALMRNRPDLPPANIERTRVLMETQIYDALVEGYEHRIAAIELPDANDRHVLAAAIECGASIIVTANLRDFPATALTPFGIVAEHPDAFLSRLIDNDEKLAVAVFRDLCGRYRNPPRSLQDILDSMKRQGLTDAAATLDRLRSTH